MAARAQGLFLPYSSGGGGVDEPYRFEVAFNGRTLRVPLLVDTGSPWLNVGGDLLPEGSYEQLDPQPAYAPPNYSSSGRAYQGEWVRSTVTIFGGDGASFTTPRPVIAFRSTDVLGVAMMGVSTRFYRDGDLSMDALNVFLNVPEIVNGTYPPGYILDRYGVRFGYTTDTLAGFSFTPVNVDLGQRTAAATVRLTGPAGSALPPYEARLPLLVDTGINYTIITPRTRPPAPPPPNEADWETTETAAVNGSEGSRVLIRDVEVSVTLGEGPNAAAWGFNTRDCGTSPIYPRGARLARPSEYGIVNTGRHFLASYQYLIELSSRVGATTGKMGFRRL